MDSWPLTVAFIESIGGPEMMLVFVIVLILFGGKKLPEFARGLGKSIREFKKAAAGVEEEFKRALEEDERKNSTPQLTAPNTPSATTGSTTDPAGPAATTEYHDEYYHDEYHDPHADPTPVVPNPTPAAETTATTAAPGEQ